MLTPHTLPFLLQSSDDESTSLSDPSSESGIQQLKAAGEGGAAGGAAGGGSMAQGVQGGAGSKALKSMKADVKAVMKEVASNKAELVALRGSVDKLCALMQGTLFRGGLEQYREGMSGEIEAQSN
jgi:hypothetical protein